MSSARSALKTVVILAPSYPPQLGGIQSMTEALVQSLRETITHVDLEVWTECPVPQPTEGVKFIVVSVSSRRQLLYRWWLALKKTNPSVVISLVPAHTVELSLLAKMKKIPWINYWHGKEYLSSSGFSRFLQRWASKLHKSVVNSEYTKANLGLTSAQVIYPWSKRVVSRSDGVKNFVPSRVVSWGRWERRKGAAFLLELSKQIPVSVMGEGPDSHLFKRPPAGCEIQWSPPMYLGSWLQAGDVAVFPFCRVPNDLEGYGLVVAEAWMAGVPAWISPECGIREVLDSEFVIPSNDQQLCSSNLLSLLRQPVSAESIQARQRKISSLYVESMNAWTKLVRSYVG